MLNRYKIIIIIIRRLRLTGTCLLAGRWFSFHDKGNNRHQKKLIANVMFDKKRLVRCIKKCTYLNFLAPTLKAPIPFLHIKFIRETNRYAWHLVDYVMCVRVYKVGVKQSLLYQKVFTLIRYKRNTHTLAHT